MLQNGEQIKNYNNFEKSIASLGEIKKLLNTKKIENTK